MSGGGIVNAIPALMMLNAAAMPVEPCRSSRCGCLVLSMLGVLLAVPAKRQMINIEQLPFPSGIAAATTLEALHGEGPAARQTGTALGVGRARSAAWPGFATRPGGACRTPTSRRRGARAGSASAGIPVAADDVVRRVAAASSLRERSSASGRRGACCSAPSINYVVLAPIMLNQHVIAAPSFRAISSWSLWIGVPMMMTSSLFMFARQWRSVTARVLRAVDGRCRAGRTRDDPMQRHRGAGLVVCSGSCSSAPALSGSGHALFASRWWMGSSPCSPRSSRHRRGAGDRRNRRDARRPAQQDHAARRSARYSPAASRRT